MNNLNKQNIDPAVFELYDAYAHNVIDRRQFIEKLSLYAIGGITIGALLSFLMPDYLSAAPASAPWGGDPRLHSDIIEYASPKGGGSIRALLCRPAAATTPLPGILVVHENRGLNPYIEATNRQAALEGYIAMAPDALSPLGGYPGNDDEGRTMQATRNRDEILEDFIAAFHHLRALPECNGQVGVVGFCFGGWVSHMLAVHLPELRAAVPFYGSQAPVADVPQITAPLQIHFAEFDERVNAGWPAYEEALKAHGKTYTAYHYPGVHHGFHNYSTPRFDKAAADLAWQRTMGFFAEQL